MFGRDKQQNATPAWFGGQVPAYQGAPGPGYAAVDDDSIEVVLARTQAIMGAVVASEQRRLAAMPQQARLGMGMSPWAEVQNGITVAVGLKLDQIAPGGPAALGGLQDGDILTAFNGTPVIMPSDVRYLLTAQLVGHAVPVTVWRRGVEGQLTVVPAPLQ
jgi:S1-C subfamily serine protease